MATIAYQPEFRPELITVFGPKDYREFRSTLEEMDRILLESVAEDRLVAQKINDREAAPTPQQIQIFHKALRHGILLGITHLSHRQLAVRMADSQLFQWFTRTASVDGVRPASKSTIERFEKMFSEKEICELIHRLSQAVADKDQASNLLLQETALRFDEIFADGTCVKAHIHFPVDWVLLRDSGRTLVKAIELIRRHGLKHRIGPPERMLRDMNKLCMEMTHVRRKPTAKKIRKRIFRRMKKLMKIIGGHARNYVEVLETRWSETDWTEMEAGLVLKRIRNVLDQLPQAVRQAHERIIGERRVDNSEKILSLYEPDVHVLVRGKAGAEVEFGNELYLAEQRDGLIVDWEFIRDQPPSESKLLKASLERIQANYGEIASYAADRGFDSAANRIVLEDIQAINAICPRSVAVLREKLEDETFCALQKRRAQTEGRIGIFKNAYLGTPLKSKGFLHRKMRMTWCILAHNLWKLGRMAAINRENRLAELAAAS